MEMILLICGGKTSSAGHRSRMHSKKGENKETKTWGKSWGKSWGKL